MNYVTQNRESYWACRNASLGITGYGPTAEYARSRSRRATWLIVQRLLQGGGLAAVRERLQVFRLAYHA